MKVNSSMARRSRVYQTVRARLDATQMIRYIGPRCPDFEPLCCVCKAWAQYDKGQEVALAVERDQFTKFLLS